MFGTVSRKGLQEEYLAEMTSKFQARILSDMNAVINKWGMACGPSIFENDRISVVADADIYNIRELSGGNPDKENNEAVIIGSLYLTRGMHFLKQLRGAFAFCIFDKKDMNFILVTDRFGIKPVVYSYDGHSLSFGSRINDVLLLLDGVPDEIDYEALVDYINLSAIPTPKTIYKNIKKLPPGYCLVADDNTVIPQMNRYYDILYANGNRDESYFIKNLPDIIEDSVRTIVTYKMRSGRKIGTFLSGGTDSSTVAGMIKKTTGHVKTFSIGFDEPGYNELEYARIAANYYGADHHEYVVSPDDVLKAVDTITCAFDEPFGNASAIPTYYCALLAKENGVDSLLAGDGGDEIFGGNERYASGRIFDMYYNIPAFIRDWFIEPFINAAPSFIPVVDKGKKYIRRANIPQPERFFSYNPVNELGIEHIFSTDFLSSLNGYDNLQWAKELYRSAVADDELDRLLYIDMKFAITDNDLKKVSIMSEKAGVKVDYPFLDHNLVNFAAAIPALIKVKGTRLRYIFKKALKDFLPQEIINKKKHGFGLPIGLWIRNKENISLFARDTLLDSGCSIKPFLRNGFIQELFMLHESTKAAFYGDVIWQMLILELWNKNRHYMKLRCRLKR